MADAIICQSCGVEAPCKHTEFHQNIGAFVLRFHRSAKGNLCKNCIHKHFWQMTFINATLGWWGVISFFVTPVFILINVFHYLAALGMDPVPPGAMAPQVTPDVTNKLGPYYQEIVNRVQGGQNIVPVAQDIAARAGVTPGQVIYYAIAVSRRKEPPPLPQ